MINKVFFIVFFAFSLQSYYGQSYDTGKLDVEFGKFISSFNKKGKLVNGLPLGKWKMDDNEKDIKILFKKKGHKYHIKVFKCLDKKLFNENYIIESDNDYHLKYVVARLLLKEENILFDSTYFDPLKGIIIQKEIFVSCEKNNKNIEHKIELLEPVRNIYSNIENQINSNQRLRKKGFELQSYLSITDTAAFLFQHDISYQDNIQTLNKCNILKYRKINKLINKNISVDFLAFDSEDILIKGQYYNYKRENTWYYKNVCTNTLFNFPKNICGNLTIDYVSDVLYDQFIVIKGTDESAVSGELEGLLPIGIWILSVGNIKEKYKYVDGVWDRIPD